MFAICQFDILTHVTRWLEGEPPQEEGQTVDAMAFFAFDNNPKYKSVPVRLREKKFYKGPIVINVEH